jgi:hypothetical protein
MGCCAGINWLMFQKFLLPQLSGRPVMFEATNASETSVSFHKTRPTLPNFTKHIHFHIRHREKMKSHRLRAFS